MSNKPKQEDLSPIRRDIKYRVEQEYAKYHNNVTFKFNGEDFWKEQIVWKLGETLEDYVKLQVLAVIEDIKSTHIQDEAIKKNGRFYSAVRLSAIEAIEAEYTGGTQR